MQKFAPAAEGNYSVEDLGLLKVYILLIRI